MIRNKDKTEELVLCNTQSTIEPIQRPLTQALGSLIKLISSFCLSCLISMLILMFIHT